MRKPFYKSPLYCDPCKFIYFLRTSYITKKLAQIAKAPIAKIVAIKMEAFSTKMFDFLMPSEFFKLL